MLLQIDVWRFGEIDVGCFGVSIVPPAGRVDSVMIDSDVTNYTLSSLFPATEYEISLSAVRGSQESKVVSTSVFTGMSFYVWNYTWNVWIVIVTPMA